MPREYFGNAAHFIGSDRCRFHIATRVTGPAGTFLVSTVGDYVPQGNEQNEGEDRYAELGSYRRFETFVFPADAGGKCACGCGLARPDRWSEIDSGGYNSRSAANEGHEAMCVKYEQMRALDAQEPELA